MSPCIFVSAYCEKKAYFVGASQVRCKLNFTWYIYYWDKLKYLCNTIDKHDSQKPDSRNMCNKIRYARQAKSPNPISNKQKQVI